MINQASYESQKYWRADNNMQSTLIKLTQEVAAALPSDFKLYLPQIVPHALKIFMCDDSRDKTVTLQVTKFDCRDPPSAR